MMDPCPYWPNGPYWPMTTMTVAEAKNRFSDLLRRAEYGGERVIVERHGKPVAAIVSTDDLRRLEATDDKVDLRDARAALAEAKQAGTVPLEMVCRSTDWTICSPGRRLGPVVRVRLDELASARSVLESPQPSVAGGRRG